jgi:hypothetical protein
VLAAFVVLDEQSAGGTEAQEGDTHDYLDPVLAAAAESNLLHLVQHPLVILETALLVAAVDIVLGLPGLEALEAEVPQFASPVRALYLAPVLHLADYGVPASRTSLGVHAQPVVRELTRKITVLLEGEGAQLAAQRVLPLPAAPLERTADLPLPVRSHSFEEGNDGSASDEVAAWHLDYALLHGDLVLNLAEELDAGDFPDWNLLLLEHVLESERCFDLLFLPDAFAVELQHHLLGGQCLAHLRVDQLLHLPPPQTCVDVGPVRLPVGKHQQYL